MAEPSGFRKTGAGQQLGIIDPAEEERRRQADAERQQQSGGAPLAGSPSPAPSETDASVGQRGGAR